MLKRFMLFFIIFSFIFSNGCDRKQIVKKGDHILIHYTGTLEDGKVFERTEKDKPLELVVGENVMPPAFENALIGLELGQKKIYTFKAKDMFGPRKKELIKEYDKTSLPAGFKPSIGLTIGLPGDDGKPIPGTVTAVTDNNVTIDYNHKLAGHSLTFNIRVVAIDVQ